MAEVAVEGIAKRFGPVRVLDGLDLVVPDGALVALLGPSGCGKTTLLRLIAGLEAADAGRIRFDGADVTALPPERRRIGMMFQSYALLPARALARALIAEPRVLLLDEPLSNLDAGLRQAMQVELLELHRRLGFTTILVTHDQEEALSLADTVVLMRAGRIEQAAAPAELYARPASAYAAAFVGGANLLPVEVLGRDGERVVVRLPDGGAVATAGPAAMAPGPALLVLRPEDLAVGTAGSGLAGRLGTVVFQGRALRAIVATEGAALTVLVPAGRAPGLAGRGPGAVVDVTWDPDRSWLVPKEDQAGPP